MKQNRAETPAGERGGEREHRVHLPGGAHRDRVGGEQVAGDVHDDRDDDDLVHQVRAEPAPGGHQERAGGDRQSREVQRRERVVRAAGQPAEARAAQQQQAIGDDLQVVPEDLRQRRELRVRPEHVEPAGRVDQPQHPDRRQSAGERPRAQRDLEPPWPAAHRPVSTYQNDGGHSHVQRQHVADGGPAEQQRDRDRYIPAAPAALEYQPGEQDRHGGADVVR
ncbi:MAG: hypothetical protein ABSA93_22235 [Streptosporangiaceae bacterium]